MPEGYEQVWLDGADEALSQCRVECILPDGSADGETRTVSLIALADGAAVTFAGAILSGTPLLFKRSGDSATFRYNVSLHRWFVISSTTGHDADQVDECRPEENQIPHPEPPTPPLVKEYSMTSGDDLPTVLDASTQSSRLWMRDMGTAMCVLPDGTTDGQRHFVLVTCVEESSGGIQLWGSIRQNRSAVDFVSLCATGDGIMLEWVSPWRAWCIVGGTSL
jgi:hypothetical protein